MAVTTDLRTATTLILADEAVTSQGFGGITVDLSSSASFGATSVGQAVLEAATAADARTAIGAMAADMSNGAGISTALVDYANDAAAAVGGVAVGAPYRNGSVLMVRVA